MFERSNYKWILIGGTAVVLLSTCVIGFFLLRGLFGGGTFLYIGSRMIGFLYSWRWLGMTVVGSMLLAGLIIVALSFMPRWSRRGTDAYAIARERYARGEINKEEYEKILETLRLGG